MTRGESVCVGARVLWRDSQRTEQATVSAVDRDGSVWVRWDNGDRGHVFRAEYLEVVE
jgi:hypothetical protein